MIESKPLEQQLKKSERAVITIITDKKGQFGLLPPELQNAVIGSSIMLDFEEDFDGQGAPVMPESIWRLVVDFFAREAVQFHATHGVWLPVPYIGYCFDSIDIHWDNLARDDYRQSLLLNVDICGASYFGYCNRKPRTSEWYNAIKWERTGDGQPRSLEDHFTDLWEWLTAPSPTSTASDPAE